MPCKVCNRAAPEVEFYNSIATYCKEHWRERAHNNRALRIEHYRAYDRARGNRLPVGYQKEYAKRFPERYRAHNAVSNAIRDGKLFPMPCIVCGEDAHAHHPDYSQPLYVIWLCPAHHQQVHAGTLELEKAA